MEIGLKYRISYFPLKNGVLEKEERNIEYEEFDSRDEAIERFKELDDRFEVLSLTNCT